ncbi:MAG: nucleotidyltransferase domain-containing protein [Bacteroidales bacterium]|nr:nucleotidyltransferase domain-containing protein [Bacteroidales bacterium]MCF8375862.1 nucleotidyltransferase domain-containing protein [Bacteroidales bacterium]
MNTLEKIFSSKARANIFKTLFGLQKNEIHLREIQRISGLTVETIRRELKNLETLELINKRIDSNRNYYQANTNHSLYNEIHNIVLKTAGLRDVLQNALSSNEIEFAFVFGSFASGKSNEDSDIDLLIVGETGLREISKQIKEPSVVLQREINPHTMTLSEFKKRIYNKDHFVLNLLDSPKLFIVGKESEFKIIVQCSEFIVQC